MIKLLRNLRRKGAKVLPEGKEHAKRLRISDNSILIEFSKD
jgi:hypothetical protein